MLGQFKAVESGLDTAGQWPIHVGSCSFAGSGKCQIGVISVAPTEKVCKILPAPQQTDDILLL